MCLLVYHVPVACGLARGHRGDTSRHHHVGFEHRPHPDSDVLFLGPLLELGAGLIVSRAPRKAALGILLFVPGSSCS